MRYFAKPDDFFVTLFLYMMLGGVWAEQRASSFEAALPISGRPLVAARLIAHMTMLWLPSLAIVAETMILGRRDDGVSVLQFAAALTFGTLAGQSVRLREAKPPLSGYHLGFTAFLLFDHPFSLNESVALGILAAVSAVLLVRLWICVPEGFQLAPEQPGFSYTVQPTPEHFPIAQNDWRIPYPAWASRWWPAWRSCLRVWGYAVFALTGFQFGGVWLGGAFMVIPAAAVRSRIEWLALLPISRRRLLLMMVFPWIAIVIAAPFLIARFDSSPEPPVVTTGYSETWPGYAASGSGTPNVLVPATYWHWIGEEDAATIRAPWGEESHPKTFLRLGLLFYNPYSVAPRNSTRFLEWQFARATKAVYGRSVPLAQSAQLRSPVWISVSRTLRAQCAAALGAALVFLAMLLLTFWFRAGGGGCLTSFICFLLFLPFLGDALTDSVRSSGPLSDILAFRFAGMLPESWAALLTLALLLLVVSYLLLEKQFQRVELAANLRRLESAERQKR